MLGSQRSESCNQMGTFLIPTFADIAPKLHGKRIFSVIDMKDGFGTYALMKPVPNCVLSTRSLVDLTRVCHFELRVLQKSSRRKPTRSSETFQMFSLFLTTCSLLLKQMSNTSKRYARCSLERGRKMFVSTTTRSNFVCNIANTLDIC